LLNHKPNDSFIKARILHFAAEPILEEIFRPIFGTDYQTADLLVEADLEIDIENIQLESNSVQTIICMHVLEHVDDKKALSEMFRVLSQNSFLILAFPVIEGWASTYENANINTDEGRIIHFGQADHIKYFGRDVRSRIQDHGFIIVDELTGSPEMCVKYGLQRGELLFLCKKP
jgi:SAM-dependent methyltransferase